MATDPKTDAEDGDHRLTPRPEDGAPLIMSCDPDSECPECEIYDETIIGR